MPVTALFYELFYLRIRILSNTRLYYCIWLLKRVSM